MARGMAPDRSCGAYIVMRRGCAARRRRCFLLTDPRGRRLSTRHDARAREDGYGRRIVTGTQTTSG